nr:MAG TPA: hypothetical protein [Caudoviricetes sp.]
MHLTRQAPKYCSRFRSDNGLLQQVCGYFRLSCHKDTFFYS